MWWEKFRASQEEGRRKARASGATRWSGRGRGIPGTLLREAAGAASGAGDVLIDAHNEETRESLRSREGKPLLM
jgi:hypothetical protein